jgi:ArsR family metal-binding transcriptional regulator
MTRAVIELSDDIGSVLPMISQRNEGWAYFPESKLASFNKGNSNIVVSSKELNIYNCKDEEDARIIADWIKNIFGGFDG